MYAVIVAQVLEVSGIEKHTHTGPIPLSFGQQQLWLLAQLMPDALVYNECVTLHLSGPLNIAVFEKSFNEILKRHEAWCTSFPVVNEQPVQYVHPYQPISLPFVDMQHLAEQEREVGSPSLGDKGCLATLRSGSWSTPTPSTYPFE